MYSNDSDLDLLNFGGFMRSDDFTCAASQVSKRKVHEPKTLKQKLFPSLHDPLIRQLVGHIDEWEIRVFSEASPGFDKLAREGLLHVQFWNRANHVSLISPSVLTGDAFEISPIKGKPFRSRNLERIRIESIGQYGLWIPDAESIRILMESWATDAPARSPQMP